MVSLFARLVLLTMLLLDPIAATAAFAPIHRAPIGDASRAAAGPNRRLAIPLPVRIVPASRSEQAPILQITKTDSVDPATPGTTLQYTIVYTNASGDIALGARITETYPSSASYLVASPLPTSGNNIWAIGDLAPGASGSIVVVVSLASQFPVGTVLTNTVRIGADSVAEVADSETTQVNSAPDVFIDKSDSDDPVHPGQLFIYTLQYGNNGNAPATGIRITETYPSQVIFDHANPPPSIGNNVWLTDTLNGLGQTRFIYVYVKTRSPLTDLDTIINPVVLDTDQTAPVTATQTTLVEAPILTLNKTARPNPPSANSLLTYTLNYANTGTGDATGVVVTDAIPLNTVYVGCAPAGLCSRAGGTVSWNLGTVGGQTSGAVTMTVLVNNNLPNGTPLTNTARISTPFELVADFDRHVGVVSSAPALSLTKSDGVTSAAAGESLIYTLNYANNGTAPAANVIITDRIPSNTSFQDCQPFCTPMGSGVYSFTLDTLAAGENGSVELTVQVDPTLPPGLRSITNTARIRTTTSGDAAGDNFAQDVDAISTAPAIALGVAFDSNTPYPTKIVTYTVAYTNTSAMDTTGVVITATRSPDATYLSGGWSSIGGEVYTRTVGYLPAGASGAATFVISLPFPFTPPTDAFVNVFRMADSGPGGLPVASATLTTTLGVPDTLIENVILSPGAVTAGTKFTVTVIIRNEGLGRACNPPLTPNDSCGPFNLNVFLDPPIPPPSFGFTDTVGYGDLSAEQFIGMLSAGKTTTVTVKNLSFAEGQSYILYFKVDNWKCDDGGEACKPVYAQHGLVPESDERNNVYGPIYVQDALSRLLYLPVVVKKP